MYYRERSVRRPGPQTTAPVTKRHPRTFPAILLLLLLAPISLFAQHEYDLWELSYGIGLDFRGGGVPVNRTGNSMVQREGVATICSRTTGELLFYTDGRTVWDRLRRAMPNGTGLLGHYSSVQAALIVPVPCDTNRFYLFTSDQQGYKGPTLGQHWSMIDMRLNGGFGDVVVTTKNTPMSMIGVPRGIPGSERLTAVAHANGQDYWVVTHSIGGREFYAYQVTPTTVSSTPVVTSSGLDMGNWDSPLGQYSLGLIKASPDGRHLVVVNHNLATAELFDFDPATGMVSNAIDLYISNNGRADHVYGATFSPDGTKVYHTAMGTIYQYSVVPWSAAAIVASRTVLARTIDTVGWGAQGAMQIAPDGNIYVTVDSGWIGIVTNPNSVSAVYNERWRKMSDSLFLGLPNNIDAQIPRDVRTGAVILQQGPVVLCEGTSLRLDALPGYRKYAWSTGETTQSIVVTSPGIYSVTLTDALGCVIRGEVSVRLQPVPRPAIEMQGLALCEGDTLRLRTTEGYAAWRWSTGATTPSIIIDRRGIYSVEVEDSVGCVGIASITIDMRTRPKPTITGPSRVCGGDSIQLDGGAWSGWLWSTGETTRTIRVASAGPWSVTVTDASGCRGTSDPFAVEVIPVPQPTVTPGGRVVICEGDSAVLVALAGWPEYRWSNGESTKQIVVRTAGLYSVRVADPSTGCVGVSFPTEVIVLPRPPAPVIVETGDTLTAVSPLPVRWYYNGRQIADTLHSIDGSALGIYTAVAIDSNGCGTPSVPWRRIAKHRFALDTIQVNVGVPGRLRLRSIPPIDSNEMLVDFSIDVEIPRESVHPFLYHPDGIWQREPLQATPGIYRLVRRAGSPPMHGETILEIELEGLSSGVPHNSVSLLRIVSTDSDSLSIGGNGLVLLTGCDVARGFRAGRRVALRSVTPNPASDRARIVWRAPAGVVARLEILDLPGRLLRSVDLPPGTDAEATIDLDLQGLPSGYYVVRIVDREEVASQGVIVVR